jgi:hypothetical protein
MGRLASGLPREGIEPWWCQSSASFAWADIRAGVQCGRMTLVVALITRTALGACLSASYCVRKIF